MTTNDFIDILQQRKLVPSNVIAQLRKKIEQGDDRITPKSILKYLVKKELVSRANAKALLETTLVVSDKAESSILGLSPLADHMEPITPKSAPKPTSKEARETPKPKTTPPPPVELYPADLSEDLFTGSRSKSSQPFGFGDDVNDPLTASSEDEIEQAAQPVDKISRLRLGGESKKKSKKPGAKSSNKTLGKQRWDSPLILMGGGAVVVLIVSSVALYWLLFREGADAILKQADAQFDSGAYQQAAEKYKEFTVGYASHQDYSIAKVRYHMSLLWEAAEGRKDFAGAAKMVPDVLANIENEPGFIADEENPEEVSEPKQQLSSLLLKIAQGLAVQLEEAKDPEVVKTRTEQINTVLELSENTKYIPDRLRDINAGELAAVRQTLERVNTREERAAELAATLAKMSEAVAANKPDAALAARAQLLKNHPTLDDDPTLAAKVIEVSQAQQAGIKFIASPTPAATEPAPSKLVAELALATRRGDAKAPAEGPVVIRADGALYGLNASDGALLWRKFVGLEAIGTPLLLPDGRTIAADAHAGELICLAADAGKLLWRQPLEGKLATPVLAGERLLVASDAGKLYVVNAADGALVGHVQFGQPLRTPPAVNDRGDRVYLAGEHSSLYTLSTDDFSCVGVCYLGHAAGGIVAPPLAMFNKVVVADNSGAETCTIRLLSLDERGAANAQVAEKRLDGLVVTPLMTEKRRFAVVTTLGQSTIFEVAAANDPSALTVLVGREAQDREQMARFGLLHDGHLWIAGRQLMKLAVLPTGNQLAVRSLDRDYQGDAFDYPIQAIGGAVIHVRRPAGQGGVIVAATDVSANKAAWETALAAPPAGAPAVDAASTIISSGSATGSVYSIDRDAMARRVQDQANTLGTAPGTTPPFTTSLDLGQGRLALGGIGSPAMLLFNPADQASPLTAINLPAPLSSAPVAWRNGFVAPSEVGQVFFYPADAASPAATPFQPELTPGKKYDWRRAAVVGQGDAAQLAISDGIERVYLVAYVAQPAPHLEAVQSVDVGPSPLASPLAVLGDRVAAVTEGGKLVMFAATDLAPAEPLDLGGHVEWGPFAAEDNLLLALDSGELVAVGADGAIRWRRPLEHGQLAGEPLVASGEAVLLHSVGSIERVALADGAEAAHAEFGQPAVAGPVAFGPRLVVAAADGTLLVLDRP